MTSTLIENAAIATVDAAGTEHARGHVLIEDGVITSVGEGPSPRLADLVVDGTGCLATPGLVNTHHHLYQWATRALAQDAILFEWLKALYPVWGLLDAEIAHATTGAGLATLALSGCTTSTDHHYVYPRDGGDVFAAQVEAARTIGLRFHPCRGSMDLGASQGGLPPDHIVETTEAALAATAEAVDAHHDASPASMLRVAVAPCSPFSVTEDLMREAAVLARAKGVRLHTHLAETLEEEEFCRERFDCTPVQYAERLGWVGPDVWLAHTVHLDPESIATLGATGTGVAHCPSSNGRLGAGIAPVRALLGAGAPVGLGVDGAASQEAGRLAPELRQALYFARLADGPAAMTAREALRLGTMGGARCLGREAEIGSLEPGKLGDVALWRLDTLAHAGIADPVAALVLGAEPPLAALLVAGALVVRDGRLTTADEGALTAALTRASTRLAGTAV
ncbi:cytosine/adenosine deaminase-related metal-dependent hydrolase [Actinocorallia herbida]|uniref:Cytosine/adenosine deaminase-related metal-dependent hydrolase n=1 Tax=Actinocorallia herbida TaxID=58109 RepID=A0A3N1D892_9ACTN|nr:8-oxoguanine deaminase [Actinocorallia herbida]ROO89689.1 cytosine/adenosine deaminase-related metal-dependent hydrolase [Actinocorallia herbida]